MSGKSLRIQVYFEYAVLIYTCEVEGAIWDWGMHFWIIYMGYSLFSPFPPPTWVILKAMIVNETI